MVIMFGENGDADSGFEWLSGEAELRGPSDILMPLL